MSHVMPMGWTLDTPDGTVLNVNSWNWRPFLALLERHGVLDADKVERLGYNMTVEVTGDEALRIASFLDGYLTGVPADGRVLLDGSITTEPDTFEFHRDDLARNYSATAPMLAKLGDFCRNARDGFTAG
jgi:hypothetical protein